MKRSVIRKEPIPLLAMRSILVSIEISRGTKFLKNSIFVSEGRLADITFNLRLNRRTSEAQSALHSFAITCNLRFCVRCVLAQQHPVFAYPSKRGELFSSGVAQEVPDHRSIRLRFIHPARELPIAAVIRKPAEAGFLDDTSVRTDYLTPTRTGLSLPTWVLGNLPSHFSM